MWIRYCYLNSSTEKEIKNVRTSRRLFIVKFGIPAICAVHDYKLIVLDIEHFGKACAGHCYFFRPCVFATAFDTSLFTHTSITPCMLCFLVRLQYLEGYVKNRCCLFSMGSKCGRSTFSGNLMGIFALQYIKFFCLLAQ